MPSGLQAAIRGHVFHLGAGQPRGHRPRRHVPLGGNRGSHARRRLRAGQPPPRADDRQLARGQDRHRGRQPAPVNHQTDADLLWALKGGGGSNFGVVTEFTFKTHAIPASATYFQVHWPWSSAAAAIDAWQSGAPHTDERANSILHLNSGLHPRSSPMGSTWHRAMSPDSCTRCSLFCIQYYGNGATSAWISQAQTEMQPFVSGRAYQNYIDPTLAHWEQACYDQNLSPLKTTRQRVDPDHYFNFPQAIGR